MFRPPINDCLLGDCGLLVGLVYPEKVTKKYKIGIVPHFCDLDNEEIRRLSMRFHESVTIISPLRKPASVIRKIKECDYIISSSLHGLIIADTFGIPNRRWVDRKTMPDAEFYDFKFKDYYSSIDFYEEPISILGDETIEELIACTTLKPQDKIKQLISNLDSAMKDVVNMFKGQVKK